MSVLCKVFICFRRKINHFYMEFCNILSVNTLLPFRMIHTSPLILVRFIKSCLDNHTNYEYIRLNSNTSTYTLMQTYKYRFITLLNNRFQFSSNICIIPSIIIAACWFYVVSIVCILHKFGRLKNEFHS